MMEQQKMCVNPVNNSNDMECIRCGKCVSSSSSDALGFSIKNKLKKGKGEGMNAKNEEKIEKIVIIVGIIWICVLVSLLFIIKSKSSKPQELQNVKENNETKNDDEKQDEKQDKEKKQFKKKIVKDDFYQKLKNRQEVNILVIGDSIGEGNWQDELKVKLFAKYNNNVNFTNISLGGNTSFSGYVTAMTVNDNIDYDLAIICYGQNDADWDFAFFYEMLVRSVIKKFPDCSIISIIESSQRTYTDKMQNIQKICKYYGIPIADTIKGYNESGKTYEQLCNDGIHPNLEGLKVYSDVIYKVIEECASKSDNKIKKKEPMDKNVELYANIKYYAKDEFTRVDDVTFTKKISQKGRVGMDYSYLPGHNLVDVYADNEKIATVDYTHNWEHSQRMILLISDEKIVRNELKVVFENKEQADAFNGLSFSFQ